MALFYSLRNGQVEGESHKGASVCSMFLSPFFIILILIWPSWQAFFAISIFRFFPRKLCAGNSMCHCWKKKPYFLDWCWCKQPLFPLLGVYFKSFLFVCFFKLMPKRKSIIICKLNCMSCILLAQQLEPLSLQARDCCYSTKKKCCVMRL